MSEDRARAEVYARSGGVDESPLPPRIMNGFSIGATGCWTWNATAIRKNGYAQLWWCGGQQMVHRIVYELTSGAIPPGMTVDHSCHTVQCGRTGMDCLHRRCVNPAHLELMTRGENAARANLEKATCPQGHAYDRRSKRGRVCSTCANASRARGRRARGAVLASADRTECPKGHEYTAENTLLRKRSNGNGVNRICRECERVRRRTRYQESGS